MSYVYGSLNVNELDFPIVGGVCRADDWVKTINNRNQISTRQTAVCDLMDVVTTPVVVFEVTETRA